MAELQKLVSMKLDEAPIPASVSQKKIKFYNLDKNTAQFQFEVTNRDKPLLISDKNIKGYAFCVSENGSTSGVIDLDFIEPLKGIVGFTVPNTFLKSATNTTATGEIYLSLNDVNNKGLDDTVVLGQFTFDVGDALINKIESDIKVDYIRMFDDLRATIENKIAQLEKDVADINNIVGEVQQAGTNAITNVNKAESDATQSINTLGESITQQLTQETENFNANAARKTTEYNDNSAQVLADLDAKKKEFDDDLAANNFLTPETFDERANALKWQKYKLTNDDGSTIYDSNIKIDFSNTDQIAALGVGTRYAANTLNAPASASSPSGWITKFDRGTVKYLEFRPYNSNQIFVKRFYNAWNDWKEIVTDITALPIQQYKLTNNDGSRISLGTLTQNIENYPPGLYECTVPSGDSTQNFNMPIVNPSKSSYIAEVDITYGGNGRKQIKVIANYDNNIYQRTVHTGGVDRGWKKINSTQTDTGWVPFQLINGANSNTAYNGDKNGFVCAYRVIKRDNETNVKIRLNGSNISKGQTIAQLPADLINYTQTGYLRVPTDKGVGVITIYTDGTIKFFPQREKEEVWTVDDASYIYGQLEFTL